jgi:hypothetical protein
VIGSYVDDRFGKVSTATVAQVRLSANSVGPANVNWVCDSLVLALVYGSNAPIYGDPDPQTFRVYRLNEDLSTDSIYKNDHIPLFLPDDLVADGVGPFTPVLDDGPIIGGDSLPAQLRIPLKNSLGAEFLSVWGQSQVSDNTNFLTFFKGLYVVPDNPGQAINEGGTWAVNLLNGNTKLTLYYHDSTVGTPLKFDFIITSGSVRYTTAQFDRTGTVTEMALADSTTGQQQTYIQSMGGLRTEIRFPSLLRYQGTPYQAVAKAELIVPVDGDHGPYVPPSPLFAFRKGDDGKDLVLPDQVTGQGSVGGNYSADALEYRLNVTRWVQGVLNGTYDHTGLGLVGGSSGISVNRVVLNGPAHPERPMRLVLTFTTY